MTDTSTTTTTATTERGGSTGSGVSSTGGAGSASRGTTVIDDAVVEKIAGIAVREVPGVHDLGGGAARAIGAIRSRLNATDRGQGISVEVGEKQAAVEVTVVADYPVELSRLADEIRRSVVDAVESLVGLEVTAVDITITDIAIPSDDDDEQPRVQ